MFTPKSLNSQHGLKYNELLDLLHESGFTKIKKPMLSAVNSPDDYGVEFTKAARKAIAAKLNIPPRAHHPRDRSSKVQAYVSKRLAHDFTAARLSQHQTQTQAITAAISLYIKNAAPGSTSSEDGEAKAHCHCSPAKEACQ